MAGTSAIYISAEFSNPGGQEMDSATVRLAVQAFRERTAHGLSNEHCFAPWYLHQVMELSEMQALEQSSDGNYDFGIDAYHLGGGNPPTVLTLVQAKYSESLSLVSAGFRGLERCLPELASALQSSGTEAPIQNKVLVNLRADLNRLNPEIRARLTLDFHVTHLSDEDPTIMGHRTQESRNRFRDATEKYLPRHVCKWRLVSPADLGPPEERKVPSSETLLTIDGLHMYASAGNTRVFYGLGRLADLVELYRKRREDLFSRNVRHYLKSKKNVEKGPAGKMKETLRHICIEKSLDPSVFAIYHNGVTIHVRRAEPSNGGVSIIEPFVLNGCQTIKNAFLFRNHDNLRERIADNLWKMIMVPVRLVESTDDDLVRVITINNNRQNAITPAALRANEPVQIRLEERFKKYEIFYERQEGAYASLEDTSPELLVDEYENTRGRAVDIVDLGRSLAAVAGEVRIAEHPNDLFESDTAYERCFSEKRLRSITFLTFLQNLHDVMGVVLKKNLNLEQKGTGPKPSRLKYYAICLLVRHLAKNRMNDLLLEYGRALWGKDWYFRDEIRKEIGTQRSGIRAELVNRFMTLESTDATTLNDAFLKTQNALRLRKEIDPFEVFADLDIESTEKAT
jgi:hypothetical protein